MSSKHEEAGEKEVIEKGAGSINEDSSEQIDGLKEAGQECSAASEPTTSLNVGKINELNDKFKAALSEVEQEKEARLRALADYDNLLRRSKREKEEYTKFANEKIFKDLLPVLDSFQKAVENTESDTGHDPSSIVAGVKMVFKQLSDVLRENGLVEVEAEGKGFDPNLHQAIQKLESDEVKQDMVSQVYAKGYLLKGRLLRPAMVSVSVPK